MTRGVLYYVWGNYDENELKHSIDSLTQFGYNYKVIVDDEYTKDCEKYQKRAGLYKASPFDITLHLDTDTTIFGNLDYGFDMAEKYGIACCIAPASSSYILDTNTIKDIMHRDLPQYNCGVIFYNKHKVENVFNRWEELLRANPKCKDNDQPYFAQAVYENMNPYILPKTWNYRPHVRYENNVFHGELKILHSNQKI